MDIDHIFIFTENNGNLADDLVSFGLMEGSSRVHEGQGTKNRTFVFDNFYLEIIWVHNEQEIKSEHVLPTSLWRRANFKVNDAAPFGLCLGNTEETNELFREAFRYQPDYFPNGMTIDMLNNNQDLCLPLTFWLPFKRERQTQSKLPSHKNGITTLTKTEFQYTKANDKIYLDYFERKADIQFTQADANKLILTFDNGNQGLTKAFEELKLAINY